jgi:hypothetical protein
MRLPHYPWYPDDYLSSPWVMACELIDEAIYRRLLDYQWKHPGCQLPDDMTYLRKLCKGARSARIEGVLKQNFTRFEVEKGKFYWRNERVYVEFCKVLRLSEDQSSKAKLRWNKEKKNAAAMQRQCRPGNAPQNHNQNQNQNKEEDGQKHQRRIEGKKAKPTDGEWLQMLKSNPAYKDLDIDIIHGKLVAWCANKGLHPTRARLLNWLNREERPLSGGSHGLQGSGSGRPGRDFAGERERERFARLARVCSVPDPLAGNVHRQDVERIGNTALDGTVGKIPKVETHTDE